jgi:REP element-mobilizing transposase RayT
MFHHVARTRHHQRLFDTWAEGVDLWRRVCGACPGLVALVVMPDHLHLLHALDVRRALADALGRYARAYHARRGTGGALVEPLPEPGWLADAEKIRRNVRYIHLNPCRAKLVSDPLAWPLSTHRDAVGIAVPPVVRPRPDPIRFHAYVSGDPHVNVEGTELPGRSLRADNVIDVLHATSAVCRVPLGDLHRRGDARTLYLRTAIELCPDAPHAEIGAAVGVSRATTYRAGASDPAVRVVARAVGDPRFQPLWDGAALRVR